MQDSRSRNWPTGSASSRARPSRITSAGSLRSRRNGYAESLKRRVSRSRSSSRTKLLNQPQARSRSGWRRWKLVKCVPKNPLLGSEFFSMSNDLFLKSSCGGFQPSQPKVKLLPADRPWQAERDVLAADRAHRTDRPGARYAAVLVRRAVRATAEPTDLVRLDRAHEGRGYERSARRAIGQRR